MRRSSGKKKLLYRIEELNSQEMKRKNDFVPLEPGFYRKVKEEFEELENELARLVREGDLSKAAELSNEIQRARRLYDDLIEQRIRKILISVFSPGMSLKNLTKEEHAFHMDLKALVEDHKKRLLGEETHMEVQTLPAEEKTPEESGVKMRAEKESTGVTEEKKEEIEEGEHEERYVIARVISPTFRIAWKGGKEVVLRKEDVLHMPEKMYTILLKRDKVAEIRISE